MINKTLPTDQEYLETLMHETALDLPDEIRTHQQKRATEAVDELIKKKSIDPKDRQYYIDFNLNHLNPTTAFQGSALASTKLRTLGYLGTEQPAFETVPVGMLSIPEMNAFAIRTPRGGSAIGLYSGLWLFLKIAFYSLLAIMFRKTPYAIGSHHTNETYVINLYSAVDAIKSGSFVIMTTSGDHSIADCVGDAAWPDKLVVRHMQHALSFILLHEYGHIHHKHLDANLTRKVSTEKADIDIYLTSHEQEFEADKFAIQRLLLKGDKHLHDNVTRITSIAMLFLLFDLCENNNLAEILGTHPRSKKRLDRIYSVCKNHCGENAWNQMQEATNYVETVFKLLNDHKSGYI